MTGLVERISLNDESRPLALARFLAVCLRLEIHRPYLAAQDGCHESPSALLPSIERPASALSLATRRDRSAIRSCRCWAWKCSKARRAYSDLLTPICLAAAFTPAAKARGTRSENEMRSSITEV